MPKRRIGTLAAIAACSVAGALASSAQAVEVISDLNSVVSIDPNSQAGVFDWEVNGVDQLNKMWFWYRNGATAEASLDTLTLVGAPNNFGDGVSMTYQGVVTEGASSVPIEVTLQFFTTGSTGNVADLHTLITVTNNSATVGLTDFHLFQYADFDLNETANDESVTFLAPLLDPTNFNTVRQTETSGAGVSETVVTEDPDPLLIARRHEADLMGDPLDTIVRLNDGVPSVLNNNVAAGVGNATWAYEWHFALPAGDTFTVNKDLHLTVPEPASLALICGGISLVCMPRRRAKR
jgi:hypothetical protein